MFKPRDNKTFRYSIILFNGLSSLVIIGFFLITSAYFTNNQTALAAKSQEKNGTWVVYTTTHGLPSNTVWGGVAIDNSGQVWAGFENGSLNYPLPSNELVSRLDGNTWVNYNLLGCRIQPFVAAEEVYAGSYCPGPQSGAAAGLSWYVEDSWITFTNTDGLSGHYLRAIAPEGNTLVWVASGTNLASYPYINLLNHKGTATKADDEWTVYDLNVSKIEAISIDPDGNRWFGTSGQGIYVLSADNSSWTVYPPSIISGADDIAFDDAGNVWVSHGRDGSHFDGTNWTHYPTREDMIEANFEAIMNSLNRSRVNPVGTVGLWAIEEPAGVWIMRRNALNTPLGVGFYDGTNWTVYSDTNSALKSNDIHGIAVDTEKNVWIGTRATFPGFEGGLYKFVPEPDFSVEIIPNTLFVASGQNAFAHIPLILHRGWITSATLSVIGLPPGANATFNPNPATPTTQVTLIITTTTTSFGVYPITISATAGGLTQTASATLHIVPKVYRYYLPIIQND